MAIDVLFMKEPLKLILVDDEHPVGGIAHEVHRVLRPMIDTHELSFDPNRDAYNDPCTALEVIKDKEFHPDVVLLDQRMPGTMDGLEFLRIVRGVFNPATPHLREYTDRSFAHVCSEIIMLSANDQDRGLLRELGAYDYLRKGGYDDLTFQRYVRFAGRSARHTRLAALTHELLQQKELLAGAQALERQRVLSAEYEHRLRHAISLGCHEGLTPQFLTGLRAYLSQDVGDYILWITDPHRQVGDGRVVSKYGPFDLSSSGLVYGREPVDVSVLSHPGDSSMRYIIDPLRNLNGTVQLLASGAHLYLVTAGKREGLPSPVLVLRDVGPVLVAAANVAQRLSATGSGLEARMTGAAPSVGKEDPLSEPCTTRSDGTGDSFFGGSFSFSEEDVAELPDEVSGGSHGAIETAYPPVQVSSIIGDLRALLGEKYRANLENLPLLLRPDGPQIPELNEIETRIDRGEFASALVSLCEELGDASVEFIPKLYFDLELPVLHLTLGIRDHKKYGTAGEISYRVTKSGASFEVERFIEVGRLGSERRQTLAARVSMADIFTSHPEYTLVEDAHYFLGFNNALSRTMYESGSLPFETAQALHLDKHPAFQAAFPGRAFEGIVSLYYDGEQGIPGLLDINAQTRPPVLDVRSVYRIILPLVGRK